MPNFTLYDLDADFLARVKAKTTIEGVTVKALILRLLATWLGVVVLALVTVSCGDVAGSPIAATPAAPVQVATSITMTSTAGSGSAADQVFLVATVKDAIGHGMSAPVTFTTTSGTMQPDTVTSGTDGLAQTKVTTNAIATVTATSGAAVSHLEVTPIAAVVITPEPPSVPSPPIPPLDPIPPSTPTIRLAPAITTVGAATPFSVGATMTDGTPIRSESWTFGDGAGAQVAGTTTAHTYTVTGTYTVQVTAMDILGRSASTSAAVTVNAAPPAPPAFTASVSCPKPTARLVACNVAATWNGILLPSATVRVDWDWGDGTTTPGTAAASSYTYQTPGTYTIFATLSAIIPDGSSPHASTSTSVIVP